ncbi:hypothetical protein DFJ73DRAFT_896447, partial [Zopfochytrium polystomum]
LRLGDGNVRAVLCVAHGSDDQVALAAARASGRVGGGDGSADLVVLGGLEHREDVTHGRCRVTDVDGANLNVDRLARLVGERRLDDKVVPGLRDGETLDGELVRNGVGAVACVKVGSHGDGAGGGGGRLRGHRGGGGSWRRGGGGGGGWGGSSTGGNGDQNSGGDRHGHNAACNGPTGCSCGSGSRRRLGAASHPGEWVVGERNHLHHELLGRRTETVCDAGSGHVESKGSADLNASFGAHEQVAANHLVSVTVLRHLRADDGNRGAGGGEEVKGEVGDGGVELFDCKVGLSVLAVVVVAVDRGREGRQQVDASVCPAHKAPRLRWAKCGYGRREGQKGEDGLEEHAR